MTMRSGCRAAFLLAAVFASVEISACGASPPMSAADHAFDKALSTELSEGYPISIVALEPKNWTLVCVVGEERPKDMLRNHTARPEERAFESLFDAAGYWSGPSSAFAFVYENGVEVRPVNGLHVNMGEPINRCVPRSEAILVQNGEGGWQFRAFPA